MTKSISIDTTSEIEPYSLKDKPSVIERIFPAQKISSEAQKERKAGPGQTLTGLGSYWKGRKPLILNRACILGALLPATDDPEMDLAVFEKLMAIDDDAFQYRAKSSKLANQIVDKPYLERLKDSYRPEELSDDKLHESTWREVNRHLGTTAQTFSELIEQLGIMRFGRKPIVGDSFCGSGQIPYEAARLGCDVYASDLNPIAAMLTWGAINVVGGTKEYRAQIENSLAELKESVAKTIDALKIEEDSNGNRAKAYLYCLETRCPDTGWLVPMAASWVVSTKSNVIARLVADHKNKRFDIEIVEGVSRDELLEAREGTVKNGNLEYELDGEIHSTPIKSIRGDFRQKDGKTTNRLRTWEKSDWKPHEADVFQQRLYAIQWITKETFGKNRQEVFFTGVRHEDREREERVEAIVDSKIVEWQKNGFIPDMSIEEGEKTDELIRTRGWRYWHQLFNPRELHFLSLVKERIQEPALYLVFCRVLDCCSKLVQWVVRYKGTGGSDFGAHVFYNQAFNTFYNWVTRASSDHKFSFDFSHSPVLGSSKIETKSAVDIDKESDIWITDPPYADAVIYHEITEFFIAWLRKNPPAPFDEWIWDSRRALAVKGTGEDFRANMVSAYQSLAEHMPENGIQIVMFTHQDGSVWADMAAIMWGAGLQVTAAWYIATETTSELKKGCYVQGTVLLVLRKRTNETSAYRDELVQEVKEEVVRQIDTLVGLNQTVRGSGRSENLFEDADLQMAGYAAALRVLTGYTHIDGKDMTAEALRPREKGDRGLVGEVIDYAVQVANEHLVPEGISPSIWEKLSHSERYYLKMLDIESAGISKLDNFQNFAKAFRVDNYTKYMSSTKANDAKLKTGIDFKKTEFEGEFGKTTLRAILFALYEIQKETDTDEVISHLRDLLDAYLAEREKLICITKYIAEKRTESYPEEAQAARILRERIENERIG